MLSDCSCAIVVLRRIGIQITGSEQPQLWPARNRARMLITAVRLIRYPSSLRESVVKR